MVMSQAAIDALMAQSAAKDSSSDAEDDELIQDVVEQAAEEKAALMAEAAPPQPEEPESGEAGGEEIDPLAGTLSAQELARVQKMAAGPPPPPNAFAQKVEGEQGAESTGVRARKWSASSTADSDLKNRVQDLEAKLTQIEAQRPAAGGGASDRQLEEMRTTIAQISETVQGMMAALRQLTEQSKGSLGFAAKQTFDCPECHSHGTISVPISCTACGFESEWGFYPESKES